MSSELYAALGSAIAGIILLILYFIVLSGESRAENIYYSYDRLTKGKPKPIFYLTE